MSKSLMQPAIIFLITIVGVAVLFHSDGRAQQAPLKTSTRALPSGAADAELTRLRAELVARMKESRVRSDKLRALYEQEQNKLFEEYQKRRSLYNGGLISRRDVAEVEVALENLALRIEEVKRWIAEDDIAITEAIMREELLRLPKLAAGAYSESLALIRFNGGARWSLPDARKIEQFFVERFGRSLPISARGQTATHDRLRLDHRDAIDVALHPDSNEGRSLIAHLRRAGIPFIAFRNAVPGAATGAHIHVGRPSVRNMASQ